MRFPFTRRDREPDVLEGEVVAERQMAAIEAQSAPPEDAKTPYAQSGKSGTGSWYRDLMDGDENPDLQGRLKYLVYEEMRQSDPAVKSLLWMFQLPIRQAQVTLVPNDHDPDGPDVAAARAHFGEWQLGINDHIGRMNLTWDEWMQQSLLSLAYGAMGEEIVWGDVETWRDEDGDEHQIRPIVQMAPRYPSTVDNIEFDERTGEIDYLEQDLPDTKPIPGSKLAWYVPDRSSSPRWGTSLLRSAYGPWKLKRGLMVASAIGWDRWAIGIPMIRHPAGDNARKEAQRIGENMQVHEKAWVAVEGPPPPDGDWDISFLSGSGTLLDPTNLLRHYDEQIAKAGLQQFSSLGTTQTGSRAVGEVLADPYYLAVKALAEWLMAARMKYMLRRLWDVNFGKEIPTPTLKVSKIQGRNIAVLARAIADFTAAGFSFTDRDTQNDMRDQMDLRHLPELPDDVGIERTDDPNIAPTDFPTMEGSSVR
jgi:hypothetical protein